MDQVSPIKISHVKEQQELPTDYNKCVVCQKEDELSLMTQESITKVITAAKAYQDKVYERLKPDFEILHTLKPKWHKKCRSVWAKTSNYEQAMKRRMDSEPQAASTGSAPTRLSRVEFSWKEDCIICGKNRDRKGDRKMYLIATHNRSYELYEAAKARDDLRMLVNIKGDGDEPRDLIACDARYHKSCFDNYRKTPVAA